MKRFVVLAVIFASQSSFAAPDKDQILRELASAYVNAFEGQEFGKHVGKWNSELAQMQALVREANDKDLTRAYEALQANNKILVNAFDILLREGKNIGKFEQVQKSALKEKEALKRATFVLPSKRKTREVLVDLAEYQMKAAMVGNGRAQIAQALEVIETIGKLRPLVSEMDKVRDDARRRANEIEEAILKSVNPVVQTENVAKAYVEKRKKALIDLKQKQMLKIEEVAALEDELTKINESVSTVYATISSLPEQFAMTVFLAAQMGGLGEAEDNAKSLNSKIRKAEKSILSMGAAMRKLDDLIEGKVEDPHFERDGLRAREAAAAAASDVEGIREKIEVLTRESLAGHNKSADKLIKEYEETAKSLPCKDARTVGGSKRGLDACLKLANDIIEKFAVDAKLAKVCRVADASALEACAKAVGKN